MYSIRRLLPGILALGAVLLAAQGASANTLTPRFSSKNQLGPNLFRYFYDVDFTGGADTKLPTGSNLFITNFLGYNGNAGIAATFAGTTWSSATSGTGTNGDATFTYTGAATQTPNITPIFRFFIESTFGTLSSTANANYVSTDSNDGAPQVSSGKFKGAAVPEMSTVAIFAGMIGTGALGLRRRTKRA